MLTYFLTADFMLYILSEQKAYILIPLLIKEGIKGVVDSYVVRAPKGVSLAQALTRTWLSLRIRRLAGVGAEDRRMPISRLPTATDLRLPRRPEKSGLLAMTMSLINK